MKPAYIVLICCLAVLSSCNKKDKIQISEVKLTSFPGTKPDGSGWDFISNIGTADVYFSLTNKGGLNYTSRVKYDQDHNLAATWDVGDEDIRLKELFEECVISLYDRDVFNENDDFIGSITFVLNSSTDNSESTKIISDGGDLSFEFRMK